MTDALPVPRATLKEMERNRDRAIALYGEAFDLLSEARRFGSLAACSQGELLHIDDASREALAPKYSDGREGERRDRFVAAMTAQTDRAMWGHIIRATDLERVMDRKARDEFRRTLADAPPPATEQNVRATLEHLLGESQAIFQRGIAVAFSSLDRRFKSHDGFKIGARVILASAFSTIWSGWNSHRHEDETLRDIERTFCVLDGKPHPERSAGICGLIDAERSKSWTVEGDYFRVRRFKNGNAHLWFTRDDLVRKVNLLLADYYGEVIGEGADVADASDLGPNYHLTPARQFGLFESPAAVVNAVFERVGRIEGLSVLEPSAGRGRLANEARERGALVQCVEIQTGLAAELRAQGHRAIEGDFLTLSPDSLPKFDVVVMNPPFDRGRDCDHVRHAIQFLKPGGLLVSVMSASAALSESRRAASLRALVDKLDPPQRWDRRWQDLPAGSFAESGTMVNTCILAVRTRAEAVMVAA